MRIESVLKHRSTKYSPVENFPDIDIDGSKEYRISGICLLSLDLKDSDYLYRGRREMRIVYVSVLHPDIIPTIDRTDSLRILTRLHDLLVWNSQ